jgi:diamine N-acetyltransferase
MEMVTLKGKNIYLRALELEDLEFLYQLENNELVWEVSNTTTPYSKFILKQYLENSYKDIFEAKQLRLVICVSGSDKLIGCVDLFDFVPKHKRVGVGIIISSKQDLQKGYASEALNMICNYVFTHLNSHQVYANITEDNQPSISLFENAKFKKVGIKLDWIYSFGKFKNELLYQLVNE